MSLFARQDAQGHVEKGWRDRDRVRV